MLRLGQFRLRFQPRIAGREVLGSWEDAELSKGHSVTKMSICCQEGMEQPEGH